MTTRTAMVTVKGGMMTGMIDVGLMITTETSTLKESMITIGNMEMIMTDVMMIVMITTGRVMITTITIKGVMIAMITTRGVMITTIMTRGVMITMITIEGVMTIKDMIMITTGEVAMVTTDMATTEDAIAIVVIEINIRDVRIMTGHQVMISVHRVSKMMKI